MIIDDFGFTTEKEDRTYSIVKDESCLLCNIDTSKIIDSNDLCYAIRDKFPVTNLHTLIIPKRHVTNYFDLHRSELEEIHSLIKVQCDSCTSIDPAITGFNIGINVGIDAGQTIPHVYVHLIPRRKGDVK